MPHLELAVEEVAHALHLLLVGVPLLCGHARLKVPAVSVQRIQMYACLAKAGATQLQDAQQSSQDQLLQLKTYSVGRFCSVESRNVFSSRWLDWSAGSVQVRSAT